MTPIDAIKTLNKIRLSLKDDDARLYIMATMPSAETPELMSIYMNNCRADKPYPGYITSYKDKNSGTIKMFSPFLKNLVIVIRM